MSINYVVKLRQHCTQGTSASPAASLLSTASSPHLNYLSFSQGAASQTLPGPLSLPQTLLPSAGLDKWPKSPGALYLSHTLYGTGTPEPAPLTHFAFGHWAPALTSGREKLGFHGPLRPWSLCGKKGESRCRPCWVCLCVMGSPVPLGARLRWQHFPCKLLSSPKWPFSHCPCGV